jgi:hypothetical protein
MSQINDITKLREICAEQIEALIKDPRRFNQAKEIFNGAGKMLGTVKLQIEYALARGEEPDIPFIGKTSGRLLKPNAKLLSDSK